MVTPIYIARALHNYSQSCESMDFLWRIGSRSILFCRKRKYYFGSSLFVVGTGFFFGGSNFANPVWIWRIFTLKYFYLQCLIRIFQVIIIFKVANKQGQTVHILQIATFWIYIPLVRLYIYIFCIYKNQMIFRKYVCIIYIYIQYIIHIYIHMFYSETFWQHFHWGCNV